VGMAASTSPCAPIVPELLRKYAAWRCRGGDGRTVLIATGLTALASQTSWRNPA
jgi:hypothetical protein